MFFTPRTTQGLFSVDAASQGAARVLASVPTTIKIIPKTSSPGREMKCEEGESARSPPPPLLPPASLLAWSPILLPPWGPAFLPALYPAAFRSAFPG